MKLFKDREDAGKQLAKRLENYQDNSGVLVIGLARGGVVVAFEIANILKVELDVMIIEKIIDPVSSLGLGGVGSGGTVLMNRALAKSLRISDEQQGQLVAKAQHELLTRQRKYRGLREDSEIKGRTVIIVDDGLATGSTMRAALKVVRKNEPKRCIVAVPTCNPEFIRKIQEEADKLIYIAAPSPYEAVGLRYENFPAVSVSEVIGLLKKADRQYRTNQATKD